MFNLKLEVGEYVATSLYITFEFDSWQIYYICMSIINNTSTYRLSAMDNLAWFHKQRNIVNYDIENGL